MTKHTPGPWKVRDGRHEGEFFVQAPRLDPSHPYDIEVLGEDHGHELYPTEMRRADANLISAAPDLLAALKKARIAVVTWSPDPTEPLNDIDAAIEKAEPK